ncbi:MAG: hypothetical protein ABI548_13140 [Polyangiaceae bacterium]
MAQLPDAIPFAEIRVRFGEPPAWRVYAVVRALAHAGRVEAALEMSVHPAVHPSDPRGDEARPPPTQDALLTLAQSGVVLSASQRKRILVAFGKAPRNRDAKANTDYRQRLAEVEQCLSVSEADK